MLLSLSRNTLAYILISFLANATLVLAYCKVIPGVALVGGNLCGRQARRAILILTTRILTTRTRCLTKSIFMTCAGLAPLPPLLLLEHLLPARGQVKHRYLQLPLRVLPLPLCVIGVTLWGGVCNNRTPQSFTHLIRHI